MRAAAAADEEFSAEFLTMARAVFDMIDKDQSGTLTKKEIVDAVANDKARTRRPTTARPSTPRLRDLRNNRTTAHTFAPFAGGHHVPQ